MGKILFKQSTQYTPVQGCVNLNSPVPLQMLVFCRKEGGKGRGARLGGAWY